MSDDVRAVVIDAFGDPPHLAAFPLPELAPDQVLIEVQAASVNAFDWKAAEGRFRDSFEYKFPVTIGRDYAGVVAAVGSTVTRVSPGAEVFGYFTGQSLHRGSYATHVRVAENECFVPRPAGLDADVAACLPLAGVVALRCVAAVLPGARTTCGRLARPMSSNRGRASSKRSGLGTPTAYTA